MRAAGCVVVDCVVGRSRGTLGDELEEASGADRHFLLAVLDAHLAHIEDVHRSVRCELHIAGPLEAECAIFHEARRFAGCVVDERAALRLGRIDIDPIDSISDRANQLLPRGCERRAVAAERDDRLARERLKRTDVGHDVELGGAGLRFERAVKKL